MRFLIAFISLALSSCATTNLWLDKHDKEYVKVVPESPEEDVELALKGSGKKYQCKVLYYSNHPNNKICYIKLTEEDRKNSFSIKFMKTPEAIVTDAGNTIKVVGYIALNMAMSSGYHN